LIEEKGEGAVNSLRQEKEQQEQQEPGTMITAPVNKKKANAIDQKAAFPDLMDFSDNKTGKLSLAELGIITREPQMVATNDNLDIAATNVFPDIFN